MRIEESLVAYLKADPAVSAAVGTRIYPVTYPQDSAMPVLVYQKVANTPEYAHDGDIGIREARFQIKAFSGDYGEAHDVAWKVEQALAPFGVAPGMMEDVEVAYIYKEIDFDAYGPSDYDPQSKYNVLSDYVFSIREQ